ncbi:taurine transport system permease protein [Allocatelliglobosispora scoriae]|uniref:Taurine transport system permease protein n=1 Tax=Allocatelliglobosispora scoriae TaxID=643052 RepID=A0A841BLA4_9ACTN|nr:ABC transporter permease [Allocatelliglobosispora scoriae]MBB5867979.1 taurine transport system permease protein [Allocatelliglobosispora scoriae]
MSTTDRDRVTGPRLLRGLAIRVLAVAVLIGAWWAVAEAEIWPPLFVPPPADVWEQLLRTSTTHDGIRGYSGYLLIEHLGVSLRRIGLGSAYGVAGGLVVGLLIGLVPTARALFGPAITFLRTLPPLAYLSLLVIWFGIEEEPKIWLLLLAALPPVAVATADAVRGVPTDYFHAARSLGAPAWQLPWRVALPAALPEILTGVRVAVGVAYTTVVAAETVNGVPGIGGMVRDAQRYNNTAVVVLGIIVIGLSGLLIDGLLQHLQRRLTPWRGRV